MIKFINEEVKKREKDIEKIPLEKQTITANPNAKVKMFKVGDSVRVMLDNPQDINGNRLNGTFTSSDIRFNPEIRTNNFFIRTGRTYNVFIRW